MEESKKKETENLSKRLESLKEEKEALKLEEKQVFESEKEEDLELLQSYQTMEKMRAACGPDDYEIKRLLDEKQNLMNSFRKKKEEFAEEFQKERREEYRRIEAEEENIYHRMKSLKNEESKDNTEEK